MYYQYELAHYKGNMGHDATSDFRSWQLQFWDPFFILRKYRRIFMTIARSYSFDSWQLQLVLYRRILYQTMIPT